MVMHQVGLTTLHVTVLSFLSRLQNCFIEGGNREREREGKAVGKQGLLG